MDPRFLFVFVENKEDITPHPVSEYYPNLGDLSINLYINLKWAKWGFEFLSSIKWGLDTLKDYKKLGDLFEDSIQKIPEIPESDRIITIDGVLVKDFDDTIKTLYDRPEISYNHKIHMKLKLNIREYLIITNLYHPTFARVEDE